MATTRLGATLTGVRPRATSPQDRLYWTVMIPILGLHTWWFYRWIISYAKNLRKRATTQQQLAGSADASLVDHNTGAGLDAAAAGRRAAGGAHKKVS